MATSTITSNPYTFSIVEDMVITPNITADVPSGSVTYKRTYSSSWTVSFTVPAHITVIRVNFTWHYNSDERKRLGWGLSTIGSGCGICNNANSKRWQAYNNRDTYVRVTPGKTYTLRVWVDGYKSRDYGFNLYWSPTYNTYDTNVTDT